MIRKLFVVVYLIGAVFLFACDKQAYPDPSTLFEYSDECPNICWNSIHPGTTTANDAVEILKKSRYIDRQSVIWYKPPNKWVSETISASWYTLDSKIWDCDVELAIENDVVQSIWFENLTPLTVDYVVTLIGAPEEISIVTIEPPDSDDYLLYYLYFSDPKVMVEARNRGGSLGPQKTDVVRSFVLNFGENNLTQAEKKMYGIRQSWLGYGHLSEYLPVP